MQKVWRHCRQIRRVRKQSENPQRPPMLPSYSPPHFLQRRHHQKPKNKVLLHHNFPAVLILPPREQGELQELFGRVVYC